VEILANGKSFIWESIKHAGAIFVMLAVPLTLFFYSPTQVSDALVSPFSDRHQRPLSGRASAAG
jgi:hypothetical protein